MDDKTTVRAAVIDAVAANAVYLLIMLAVTVAWSRRDALAARWAALRAWRPAWQAEADRAAAELQADVSAWEHRGGPL